MFVSDHTLPKKAWLAALVAAGFALSCGTATAQTVPAAAAIPDTQQIQFRWGERIVLRDGVELNAAIYRPRGQTAPVPCIVTMTPYTALANHTTGAYYAARGLVFVSVDVRGRGESGGELRILGQEKNDSADVIKWMAGQPWCNGKVAMWGGSYLGYIQWSAANARPEHLVSITPAASPYMGVDYPGRGNIRSTEILRAGMYISGRASQMSVLIDNPLWSRLFKERVERGEPFKTLGSTISDPSRIPLPLAEWEQHPTIDAYWDSFVPTDAEFAAIDMPVLSITGLYDAVQLGALEFYKRHTRLAPKSAAAKHFLVIGPWDHAGTRMPRPSVGGLSVAPAGLVDLQKLHLDWYNWTLAGGETPAFLKKNVAYYVAGLERWRYADTLEGVTSSYQPLRLGSVGTANRLATPGTLTTKAMGKSGGKSGGKASDTYIYDPADLSDLDLQSRIDPSNLTDDRLVAARDGRQLVYNTAAFDTDQEISGFFRLSAWIAIDQPDTDFSVAVYEVRPDGSSVLLATDQKRARYRQSERKDVLVTTAKPQLYDFDHFTFTSRRIAAGNHLRLVISPTNPVTVQKNYNSGKPVSDETLADARPVTVTLFHDRQYPSTLHIPLGQPE